MPLHNLLCKNKRLSKNNNILGKSHRLLFCSGFRSKLQVSVQHPARDDLNPNVEGPQSKLGTASDIPAKHGPFSEPDMDLKVHMFSGSCHRTVIRTISSRQTALPQKSAKSQLWKPQFLPEVASHTSATQRSTED